MPFRGTKANKQGLVGIGVDITERCNWDCLTCFAAQTTRDMSWEIYTRIVNEGARLEFPELYILGGEPGTRRDILDILRYGAERFPLVFLVTNMDCLAKEKLCQQVAEMGIIVAGQRHTMVNSEKTQRIERYLTGGNHLAGNHAGWKNVEKYFPPDQVCVQCCITAPVVVHSTIFEVFRWARQKGYEIVMEFTKEGRGFKRGGPIDIPPVGMIAVLQEFQRIDREEFGLPGAELLSPQAYGRTCHMQETSVHFLVNGEAIPCVGFPGLSYGNIRGSRLEEILAHPLRQYIKNTKDWIYGYCRNECPYFEKCTGGCRGSAFDIAGCYRASFYYCPHIPHENYNIGDMIPPTCKDCPLEGTPTCKPKRDAKKISYWYCQRR